ncbi:MAG: DUF2961 domain-containing protein [Candidatus Sumerlaeia bacterium]|nr:DUF2961 domain-containing protein [Candidatus Sumerlaeia bacterium]
MKSSIPWTALFLAGVLATAPAAFAARNESQPPVLDYVYFLNLLTDLDRLPFLDTGVTCKQFSSYDRTSRLDEKTGNLVGMDANGDSGKYLRTDGDEAVMAEMNGPGCIFRIWSANPSGKIRIYLDGDKEPTLAMDFSELFSGALGDEYPFVPPLVWQRLDAKTGNPRASLSYAPIPYAKSCKVTVTPPQPKMYYHIGYQTFPADTRVETFRLPLTKKERAALERVRATLRNAFDAETMPTEAGKAEVARSIGKKNIVPPDPQKRPRFLGLLGKSKSQSGRLRLQPGQQVGLGECAGPAMITEFHARLDSTEPHAYRKVLLRAYWDGETKPSIETPLVEFFGISFGPTTYHSLPMGATSKTLYSFWRMPFKKSARFFLINEGNQPADVEFKFVWEKRELPDNTAYFHARWRRDPLSKDFDYPFLECTGSGRFVGVAHFIHNIAGGWWGEGDEKVWVDGEKFPSTFGTGSEDYYGDAWGIRWFSNPYAGCPVNLPEAREAGQMQTCYRWHISDFIPFEKSFQITIENYSAKSPADRPKNDYASVAYWYQLPGGSDFFPSYSVQDRLPRPTPTPEEKAKAAAPKAKPKAKAKAEVKPQ